MPVVDGGPTLSASDPMEEWRAQFPPSVRDELGAPLPGKGDGQAGEEPGPCNYNYGCEACGKGHIFRVLNCDADGRAKAAWNQKARSRKAA